MLGGFSLSYLYSLQKPQKKDDDSSMTKKQMLNGPRCFVRLFFLYYKGTPYGFHFNQIKPLSPIIPLSTRMFATLNTCFHSIFSKKEENVCSSIIYKVTDAQDQCPMSRVPILSPRNQSQFALWFLRLSCGYGWLLDRQ